MDNLIDGGHAVDARPAQARACSPFHLSASLAIVKLPLYQP